ncbi:MAG: heme-dependent oxidative N-demethylase subunit alpha family protein [Limisphaerales bacterium]
MPELPPNWTRLFPDEDYGFHFGVHRGPAAAFFAPTDDNERLLAERDQWLNEQPERHVGLLPEGEDVLEGAVSLLESWQLASTTNETPRARLTDLSRQVEADLVLMKPNAAGAFIMVGGSVCFPSSWRLTDKLGLPLGSIHEPVPGLNHSLGDAIDRFLRTLKPDSAAFRANWGLSRSPELNQHPDLERPPLMPPVTSNDVFVRIENQALVALPGSDGILFGIRLEIIPLPELAQYPKAVVGLKRALRTMPDEVADYKNLSASRAAIIELLN